MKTSNKILILVAGMAILGGAYSSSRANEAPVGDTIDCSVPDPAVCTKIKTGEDVGIIIYGKAKPVVNPE